MKNKQKLNITLVSSFSIKSFIKANSIAFIMLAFLVLVTYANALGNDFVSDDRGLVMHVPTYTLKSIFDPFVFFRTGLYFLIYSLFGMRATVFRIPNIIFHIGSVWLIFLLLGKMKNRIVGFLSAVFFAVHPVLVESVVWISGGVYPQYSFFFLFSFLMYSLSEKKKKYYVFSLLFFVLSLLSSEKAVVLFLAPILYEICFGDIRRHWKKTSGFLVLSILYLSLSIGMGRLEAKITGVEVDQGSTYTLTNPFEQIPVAISSYIELIFWPQNLTLYHSEMIFSQFVFLQKVAVFLVYIGLIGYCFKRNRFLFFWLTFFMIALLPTLTPFGISWLVAERYVYLGSIGIFVIIAQSFYRLGETKKNSLYIYAFFALLIIGLFIRTIVRNIDWQNEDNLWISAAKTSPSSSQNHNNLGDYYGRHGNIEKAIGEFKIAIELRPNYADAYHNLGNAYRDVGDTNKAIESYKKALSINPKLWQSYQNIAAIYFLNGKYDGALLYIEKGIRIDPQNTQLLWAAGSIYGKLGLKNKASDMYNKILVIDPGNKVVLDALQRLNK